MTMTFGMSADNMLCMHQSSFEELVGKELDEDMEWLPEELAIRIATTKFRGQSWFWRLFLRSCFARPSSMTVSDRIEIVDLLPKRERRVYEAWETQKKRLSNMSQDPALHMLAGIAAVAIDTVRKDLDLLSLLGLLHFVPPTPGEDESTAD